MAVVLVISGGQTGADQGGLRGAKLAGVKTGGMMPKGFRTQEGPRPDLAAEYGLIEHPTSSAYPPRTEWNVQYADGTVLVGHMASPGCGLTIRLCIKHGKPYITNPTCESLKAWLAAHDIRVLNVAGNREHTNSGIHDRTRDLVLEALS